MQSHAIVVSVLATIIPIPAIRELTPTATPILIQDRAPDQPSHTLLPPVHHDLRFPRFVVRPFYTPSPSPGPEWVCLAFSTLPIMILSHHPPGQR